MLYLVFLGFQFWQGRGDGNVVTVAFRLLRVAIIFFIATSWGPLQIAVYRIVNYAPVFVSNNIMLNNIINPDNGKAMTVGTVATDLSTIYVIAVKASVKIEKAAAPPPLPSGADGKTPPQTPATQPASKTSSDNPLDETLASTIQAAIVWLSAALFVGYAVFLMVFAKIALWVMLSLAPVFIILLVFQMPSRFFSGWLTATIQVILVPIFLSTFLSFYILGVRGNVMTLYKVVSSHDDLPIMMKDAAPIVLICLAGLFLLAQIVPLAGRIASGTQEWATNALSQTGGARKSGEYDRWRTRTFAGPWTSRSSSRRANWRSKLV